MFLPMEPVRERERFADRTQAGRELARALAQALGPCTAQPSVLASAPPAAPPSAPPLAYPSPHDPAPWALPPPVVLALPRGGLPVALEVARALRAPLDLLLVRKIGAPGQPELAVGALAWVPAAPPGLRAVESPVPPELPESSDDFTPVSGDRSVMAVLDAGLMAATGADQVYVQRAAVRESAELQRRHQRYLQGRAAVSLHGRTVIVVDDGVATGTTVRAALKVLRLLAAGQAPRAVVLAVPVAPAEVLAALAPEVDAIVCLWTPEPFIAVGAHYRAFAQVSDEEVVAALRQAAGAAPGPQA